MGHSFLEKREMNHGESWGKQEEEEEEEENDGSQWLAWITNELDLPPTLLPIAPRQNESESLQK